ncbi:Zinc finger and BTB domain-containing protein 24 [Orchesella cincta]|uniref:Zinc finger and BTB domain-containing protein 24 n=1 Tax=Orchesella cincta TaxID=48709 RepID=A0A1D2MXN6_ORCCI|nr:Zinc finger and BTB domain-containing protein 24 [Orchesella cincta]
MKNTSNIVAGDKHIEGLQKLLDKELRNLSQEFKKKEEDYKTRIKNTLKDVKSREDEIVMLKEEVVRLKRSCEMSSTRKENVNKTIEEATKLKGDVERATSKLREAEQTLKREVLKAKEEMKVVALENLALKKQENNYLETIQNLEYRFPPPTAEVIEIPQSREGMYKRNLNGHLQLVNDGLEQIDSSFPACDDSGIDLGTNHLQLEGTPSDATRNETARGRRGRKRLALDPDFEHAEDTIRSSTYAFYCNCGSLFSNKEGLKGHFDRENNRNLGCSLCEERFYIKSKFVEHLQKKHKITLDGNQQTGCRICNAIFTTREEYVAHYKEQHSSAESSVIQKSSEPPPAEIYLVNHERERKSEVAD